MWFKKRHLRIKRFVGNILLKKFKKNHNFTYDSIDLTTPKLVLCNHQNINDQFFISIACNHNGYFVISDDFMSMGLASKILDFTVKPIPYKKGSTDLNFLRVCKKVIAENQAIIMFPEGNRTYSGETGYINKTVVKMIRFLKVPLVLIQINGGYLAQPRFQDHSFKENIKLRLIKELSYEDYSKLSDEELFDLIKSSLYVNENIDVDIHDYHDGAKFFERVAYFCPKCGISYFKSNGNTFTCQKCMQVYTIDKNHHIDNDLIDILSYYNYQIAEIKKLLINHQLLLTEKVNLIEVTNRYKKKMLYKNATIELYDDQVKIIKGKNIKLINFEDIISSGVFGKNKCNYFLKDATFQLAFDKSFNALKYMQIFYHYKHMKGEVEDDFFGI